MHFYCISLPPSTNIDPRFITRIAVVAEGAVRCGEARNINGCVEIFKTIMDVGTDISETIINLDSRHKFAGQLSQLSNIVNSTAISDCPIRCGYHTIRCPKRTNRENNQHNMTTSRYIGVFRCYDSHVGRYNWLLETMAMPSSSTAQAQIHPVISAQTFGKIAGDISRVTLSKYAYGRYFDTL